MHRLFASSVFAMALVLGACQDTTQAAPAPVHGAVSDMTSFDVFIATHPTRDQFHVAYPDVLLVLPGMPSTRELRDDHSRYFAELDKDGHVTGGHFR